MIFKILVFIGIYFLIKNILLATNASSEKKNIRSKTDPNNDAIDAEYTIIKED